VVGFIYYKSTFHKNRPPMHHTDRVTRQQQSTVKSVASRCDSYQFFNLLTSDMLFDKVEALLPEHRERRFPPTETLSKCKRYPIYLLFFYLYSAKGRVLNESETYLEIVTPISKPKPILKTLHPEPQGSRYQKRVLLFSFQ